MENAQRGLATSARSEPGSLALVRGVIASALTVVGQHLHDPAGADPSAAALPHHPAELVPEQRQSNDLLRHGLQVTGCYPIDLRAVALGLVGKIEQRADVGDVEPEPARVANEAQASDVRGRIAAIVAARPLGRGQQTDALIIPHRLDLGPGRFG